jgi:acyl dehydratase
VDTDRAADGPFGTTIGHGFLTLSLCVPMLDEVLPPSDAMTVNYGTNRVRFPAPVPSGGRIRGRFRVASVEAVPQGERAVIEATIECDGVSKPVCVAELVVLSLS